MMRHGCVVALLLVAMALFPPIPTAADGPQRLEALYVYDSGDRRVGRVLTYVRDLQASGLDFGEEGEGAIVAFRAERMPFLVIVSRSKIASIDSPGGGPYFTLPDCTGVTYIQENLGVTSGRMATPTAVGPPGRTVYGIEAGAIASNIAIASEYLDVSGGGCMNFNPPVHVTSFPAAPLADLGRLTPPFSIR